MGSYILTVVFSFQSSARALGLHNTQNNAAKTTSMIPFEAVIVASLSSALEVFQNSHARCVSRTSLNRWLTSPPVRWDARKAWPVAMKLPSSEHKNAGPTGNGVYRGPDYSPATPGRRSPLWCALPE